MQELTVNIGKRSVSNSIIFTTVDRKAKRKIVLFFAFLFSKGPGYWVSTDFSMWEKVIRAVNSAVALNEDSTKVNISG